jgi:hypothetical protein
MRHKEYLQDVGLLARFTYTCPVSTMGHRRLVQDRIPESAKYEYWKLMERLLAGEVPSMPQAIELSEDAFAVFNEFYDDIERSLLAYLAGSKAWLGKLCGAVARIAGLIHLAKDEGGKVSLETMLSAMNIGSYLRVHAEKAMGMMSADPELRIAQRIIGWISRNNIHEFGRSEVFSGVQTTQLNKADQLDEPLRILESHGYIRPLKSEPGRRGRPGQRYEVNPNLGKTPC